MHLLAFVLAATLEFTVSPWQANPEDCTQDGTELATLGSVRLWGARVNSYLAPVVLRWHQAIAGPDTFIVDDSAPGWTYGIDVTNVWGRASCAAWTTVGIPSVGVVPSSPPRSSIRGRWFDLSGRRMDPGPAGRYWTTGRDTTIRSRR